MAIFEEKDQKALLGACESDNEFVPTWLMLRCGMHPSDISQAKEKFKIEGNWLSWKRAKNQKSRRELIPKDVMPRVKRWLERGRKNSRVAYYQLVRRIGERVGHPEYSPMTLRHTYCLQELRRFMRQKPPPPDFIGLVSQRMGCSREVVMENYIDLSQWESVR